MSTSSDCSRQIAAWCSMEQSKRELIEVLGERPEVEEHLWGVTAILEEPERVKQVHRQYVDAGCDVLSTNTWGLASGLREFRSSQPPSRFPVHWMDVAREGVRLVSAAAEEDGTRRRRAP